MEPSAHAPSRWLVLTHHLPPDPPYLRVKVRRRLDRLGAVALKNSVYVLPSSSDALEDFAWLHQEIEREGGEATIAEASFVDGVTDARLIEAFCAARDADYGELISTSGAVLEEVKREGSGGAGLDAKVSRLIKRLEEVRQVDFFQAPGRAAAEQAVRSVKMAYTGEADEDGPREQITQDIGHGRTWVTRVGARVDRIASAWLIRRFIDSEARFRFAPARGYRPAEGELRFDMFEGEFTHVGDACTFETLRDSFALRDPALIAIGEIVHDIDCKDDKYGRPEGPGVASLIDGIVRRYADDETRLQQGRELFDGLYEHFAGAGDAGSR